MHATDTVRRGANHRRPVFVPRLYIDFSPSYNVLKTSVKIADAIYGARAYFVYVSGYVIATALRYGQVGYARRSRSRIDTIVDTYAQRNRNGPIEVSFES